MRGLGPRFQDDRPKTPFKQMGGGREPNGTSADDGDCFRLIHCGFSYQTRNIEFKGPESQAAALVSLHSAASAQHSATRKSTSPRMTS